MVIDETLFAFLLTMPLLAALGLTTLAAFILMPILGLVSEWSFKRIFFVSFFLGLIAPVIVGVSLAQSANEFIGGRDLRDVIAESIPNGEQRLEQWEQAGERAEEIVRAAETGEISEENAKQQLEALINEQTGFQVDLDDVQIDTREGGLRIESQ
ncbi:MAG: hypothetical protein AAF697_01880 [Pseudomonadota bacterium]